MSVTITVTDPSSMDRAELIHVLDFLAKYAGFTGAASPSPQAQHRTDLPPTPPMPAPQPVPQPPAAPIQLAPEQVAAMDETGGITTTAGIDVDSAGLPWDGRIHASTRAKVADGTWRMKRGVEPEEVAKVEAELRQTMAIPVASFAPAPVEPVAPVPPAPVAPPPPSVGSAVPPAPPVSSTPVESAGAAQTASPSNGPGASSANQFPRLMQMITQAYTQGKLDQPRIQAAVAKAGLPSLPMLASRPDLVPVVATELGFAL